MWHEIKIKLPDEQKEPVSAVLFEYGCIGLTEEPGSLSAYFPEDADVGVVIGALNSFSGIIADANLILERDWQAEWKERFGPVRAAGLLICPPWKRCEPDTGEKLVLLDPGNAFGAGDHVTTLMVLGMLKDWCDGQEGLPDRKFLDLGTGTGILAIAARTFGVGDITAVDVDNSAVESAARNFALNGIVGKVKLMPGGIKEAGRGYDLIAANIFLEPLIEAMPLMAGALKPGGCAIVSGLLEGQEGMVFGAAGQAGLSLEKKATESGWVCALLRARP